MPNRDISKINLQIALQFLKPWLIKHGSKNKRYLENSRLYFNSESVGIPFPMLYFAS